MEGNFVHINICEKNSSVNSRFEIFVMGFRVRKLFGTFEKWAPGDKPWVSMGLSFEFVLWVKSVSVKSQIKATEQYFPGAVYNAVHVQVDSTL